MRNGVASATMHDTRKGSCGVASQNLYHCERMREDTMVNQSVRAKRISVAMRSRIVNEALCEPLTSIAI